MSFFGDFAQGFLEQKTKDNEAQRKSDMEVKLAGDKKKAEIISQINLSPYTNQIDAQKKQSEEQAKKAADEQDAQKDRDLIAQAAGRGVPAPASSTPSQTAPTPPAQGGGMAMPQPASAANTPPAPNTPQSNGLTPTPGNMTATPVSATFSAPTTSAASTTTPSTGDTTDHFATPQTGGATPSLEERILAAKNISLSSEDTGRIKSAKSPEQALSDQDFKLYSTFVQKKESQQASEFLKNNDTTRAFNILHGKLADGTEVAPADLARTDNDPYQLYNPKVDMRIMASDKNTYDKETLNRFKETSDDKTSAYTTQVAGPREQATKNLDLLTRQEQLNDLINSGTGAGGQEFFTKLGATLGLDGSKPVASANDLMTALTAQEKSGAIRVPGQRVTNQEAQQFFQALPNSGQTPEGRMAIIQFMKAQNARTLEATNILDEYKQVNGTLRGSEAVLNKYFNDNKIVATHGLDPSSPSSIINPNVKSFANWRAEQLGVQVAGPNGTSINKATGQVAPDQLRSTLFNGNNQPNTAPTNTDVSPKVQSFISKFF
jgi:hypothetical protein